MKYFFISYFLFFLVFTSNGQYLNTSADAAAKIKKSILLVGLAEENAVVIRSFEGDQTKIQNYKNGIEGRNLALKNAVDSFWYFSQDVKFLPLKSARTLMKTEKDKYALIHFGEEWAPESLLSGSTIERQQIPGWIIQDGKLIYNSACRTHIDNFKIFPLEIGLPKKVFEVFLPTVYPSEGDLILALQHIQYTLTYLLQSPENTVNKYHREADHRANDLKAKTLLVDQNELRTNVTADELLKIYPYPFKAVSYVEIEKALKSKDTSVAIVNITRFDTQNSIYMVTNAGTGNLYFFKTSFTFEHIERLGEYALMIRPYGLTRGILSEIATAVKE